jgi:MazG family protein
VTESQADEPPRQRPPDAALDRALGVVEFLRASCPWDAAQTHRSLRRYLLEEAHEVLDAIDGGDDDDLRDELGDLLLNLAFQVVLGEERGAFDREEVVRSLERKMKRRHPHLYGGEAVPWDRIKAGERAYRGGGEPADSSPSTLLGDLFPGADPLAHAHRVQARVAGVGFDWADASGAWEKVREEVEEVGEEFLRRDAVALEEEIGDLLFAVVNFARLVDVHPSTALARANAKFSRRFTRLEALAAERGIEVGSAGLEALDRIWDDVKREER